MYMPCICVSIYIRCIYLSHPTDWISCYVTCGLLSKKKTETNPKPKKQKPNHVIKIVYDDAFTKIRFKLKCSIPFQWQWCTCINKPTGQLMNTTIH